MSPEAYATWLREAGRQAAQAYDAHGHGRALGLGVEARSHEAVPHGSQGGGEAVPLGGVRSLLVGGLLAMLIRFQWAFPWQPVPGGSRGRLPESGGALTPPAYTAVFTMHGLLMVFFAVAPLLFGALGALCLPLAIGARGWRSPGCRRWGSGRTRWAAR